ncbi:MAG: DNA-3-methyladenine glycosylase 2 family protein, partial [Candidatus Levybacteria bacterium]|nr:DNA-3-methyladenine glycosylase 2 family protein [Candidatus Levybacteria bacterium]
KITAKYLLTIPDQKLRSVGTSWGKVSFLKDLAQKVINGELNLKTIDSLGNEEITKELLKVKGIGPWTAEMFLMFALGRPDVFSAGDLGLQNAMIRLYKLNGKPDKNKLLEISAKWSPHRTIASRILWRSLDLK